MSSPLTAGQAPPAGQYALDPARTSVSFVTRHMFGLAPARGTLAARHLTIEVTAYATKA
jgi:hypothetical protein